MKQKLYPGKRVSTLCFTLFVMAFLITATAVAETPKVSSLGQYSGYSEPVYDGWERVSHYIPVQVGTPNESRMAADFFMPTKAGSFFYEHLDEAGQPVTLPVIWTHEIYQRAFWLPDGSMFTWLYLEPWLMELLKHGYVVAVVDVRGTGASFGVQQGPFSPLESGDTYDVTEWLAAQAWSNGNVGMFGLSYMGMTQYQAAAAAPPSLKCIAPSMAGFDIYSFVYPGGVFEVLFGESWSYLVYMAALSQPPAYPSVPVDEDIDGSMMAQAIAGHVANVYTMDMLGPSIYRDSIEPVLGEEMYSSRSSHSFLGAINRSGIPVYLIGGWMDAFSRDALVWYKNLKTPKKLTMGPWEHQGHDYYFHAAEHLRWFDYWLKGIDNGIMDEKPIHYYVNGAPEGSEWRGTKKWPLRRQRTTPFFFHKGNTGTVDSVNDGYLRLLPSLGGKDEYTVDYSTTTGFPTRWTNCWEPEPVPFGYPDMTYNDEKGLTYTSNPLPWDLEVTGHPVVHLWVSSSAADGDFYVYIEEIGEGGYSNYISEGVLRASHRKLGKPGYKYLGLPWHPSREADMLPLAGEPVELVLDILPISNIFDAGNRIRITITCADNGNRLSPELVPAPTVSIHRGIFRSSRVDLPVVVR